MSIENDKNNTIIFDTFATDLIRTITPEITTTTSSQSIDDITSFYDTTTTSNNNNNNININNNVNTSTFLPDDQSILFDRGRCCYPQPPPPPPPSSSSPSNDSTTDFTPFQFKDDGFQATTPIQQDLLSDNFLVPQKTLILGNSNNNNGNSAFSQQYFMTFNSQLQDQSPPPPLSPSSTAQQLTRSLSPHANMSPQNTNINIITTTTTRSVTPQRGSCGGGYKSYSQKQHQFNVCHNSASIPFKQEQRVQFRTPQQQQQQQPQSSIQQITSPATSPSYHYPKHFQTHLMSSRLTMSDNNCITSNNNANRDYQYRQYYQQQQQQQETQRRIPFNSSSSSSPQQQRQSQLNGHSRKWSYQYQQQKQFQQSYQFQSQQPQQQQQQQYHHRHQQQQQRSQMRPRSQSPHMPSISSSSSSSSLSQQNSTFIALSQQQQQQQQRRNAVSSFDGMTLEDIVETIVDCARDQAGSRFIQQHLDSATPECVSRIFQQVLPHTLTLSQDVFANYVVQGLFDLSPGAEDATQLAEALRGNVASLARQTYGCRVVQKMIECPRVPPATKESLIRELDDNGDTTPGARMMAECACDQNGNHVIQKCVDFMRQEDLLFIVRAFRGCVTRLTTNAYGCRVIQRILEKCTPVVTGVIIPELIEDVVLLAQDQYGNYIVQYVICHDDSGTGEYRAAMIRGIRGRYAELSKHKFASNVVEKCVVFATPEERDAIIMELLKTTTINNTINNNNNINNSIIVNNNIINNNSINSTIIVNNNGGNVINQRAYGNINNNGRSSSVINGCQQRLPTLVEMAEDQFANYVVQKILEATDQDARVVGLLRQYIPTLRKSTFAKHLVTKIDIQQPTHFLSTSSSSPPSSSSSSSLSSASTTTMATSSLPSLPQMVGNSVSSNNGINALSSASGSSGPSSSYGSSSSLTGSASVMVGSVATLHVSTSPLIPVANTVGNVSSMSHSSSPSTSSPSTTTTSLTSSPVSSPFCKPRQHELCNDDNISINNNNM